jgi:RNA polymerase sigma-70 factor (ECF subfamily)
MTNLFPNLDGETSAVFGQPLDLGAGAERQHPAQRAEVMHLFRELRTPLYGYLVCNGVQPQEAEDVIQDTFLRLHEQLCQGIRITEPRPWLFRVAHGSGANSDEGRRFFYEALALKRRAPHSRWQAQLGL